MVQFDMGPSTPCRGAGPAAAGADGGAVLFGPFQLLPAQHLLLEDGKPVRLSSRALDILAALVERPGELVGKDELIARVWPDTTVEEVNLRVHVSALRGALRDGQGGRRYLATIPGRGYRFVCPVTKAAVPVPPPRQDDPPPQSPTLPPPLLRMIGRDAVTGAVAERLAQRRFVTVVGPGGIGKTTIAVAVADRLAPSYPDGVRFADLASLPHGHLVPAAVASVLGLSNFSEDPSPGVAAFLREKRLLLVLDGCERVVEGAAALVERMLRGAPGVHVLATSREPLRAEGEWALRLPPLELPPPLPTLTAAQALEYPAVQLFVERASAVLDGFALGDADAPVVAEICARLDGIALAIELVAGHAAAFDLRSLAELLDDRFRLLARGRRTALPRHQTMRAALDWSYETVPDQERIVLRRLAVFDGSFTLAAARAVASDAGLPREQVDASIAELVDKSLVAAEIGDAGARYRLLDTTRAYALEKLAEGGERQAALRRHAEHCLATFAQAEAEWAGSTTAAWLAAYGREIGNVRAALDWAFSDHGDPALAVALSAATVPLMFELSLAEECRRRAAQVLLAMEAGPARDRRLEVRLRVTLGAALMYTPGPVPQTRDAWAGVLEAAAGLDDPEIQARALWGLWTACIYGGAPREALAFAEQFCALAAARSDGTKQLLGERIAAVSLHYMGEQPAARDRLQRMLARYVPSMHRWHTLGFQIDHGLMARATLARILWLQGEPDHALRTCLSCITLPDLGRVLG